MQKYKVLAHFERNMNYTNCLDHNGRNHLPIIEENSTNAVTWCI